MPKRDQHPHPALKMFTFLLALCLLGGIASSQGRLFRDPQVGESPEAEFHLARLMYRTQGGGGSGGFRQPWWAIDYPEAEEHFIPALRRMTNIESSDDSRHLEITDDRVFKHPFLFIQQPGQGRWSPNAKEAERFREYLLRGGFLLIDDLHGDNEWYILEEALGRILPGREIVEIPEDDALMHIFFDLGERQQIPGKRHLGWNGTAQMQGPPHWRGIYDDEGRLMVAINFNIDMGDAWEHADDADYPLPMTAQAYQLGINYVLYAMTH